MGIAIYLVIPIFCLTILTGNYNMIFEAKNGRVFKGFPIDKYHYKLNINESCYAVRFVLYNEEEYILAHCKTEKEAKIKCSNFNKNFKTKTHFIKVTRVSENKYEYDSCTTDVTKSQPGTPYGSFTQEPYVEDVGDFTIGGKYTYNNTKSKINTDEFTIGASVLAEECRKENPIFDDEFTIGASYASSDFYEYQTKNYLSSLKKRKK